MAIDERGMMAASNAYAAYVMARPGTWKIHEALKVAIEAYEAECWRSIDQALWVQVDNKTLNVTDKRLAAILDVNQYHIKQMNKFKNRIDAAKKRLGDLKAKHTEWHRKHPLDCTEKNNADLINDMESITEWHRKHPLDCTEKNNADLINDMESITEWYRKHPLDCTEKNNADLINDMESIAYSVSCYLDGVSGSYLEKEETY